jgi:cephalosporin hydroxylase
MAEDRDFTGLSNIWIRESIRKKYAQNFSWLGRPIIQVPQDVYALQEIIWKVNPDLIIETGVAHGGSLVMSASMLALLDYCEAVAENRVIDPRQSKRRVVGIDIDIRAHNRKGIESHPLAHLINLIQGSSIAKEVVDQVTQIAAGFNRVLVCLDSNHTHDHVLAELEAYAPLTAIGSYCIVWDTGVEDLPDGFVTDRPWGKGNNPKTAVFEYLRRLTDEGRNTADGAALRFSVDKVIEHKLAITAAPDGFLKRINA